MNKKNTYLVIVALLLIIVLFFLYNLNTNKKNNEVETNDTVVNILSDYSTFFTVNSSVYKYVTFLQNKDYDSVMKVLNLDYITSNGISLNNITNYVENLNGNYTFSSKKIYYEDLDEYKTKYYVYGYLIKDTLNGMGEKLDRYYIVILDKENQIFNIMPFDKVGFEEAINE